MRYRLLSLILLALASCSRSPREEAEKRLKKIDIARLRLEAAVLYKNMYASAGPSYTVIKVGGWPESFRALEPKQVGAYRDGFTLAFKQNGEFESGLYITPAQMDVQPHSTARAQFERIADGIYWYSFQP
jgi:hypothetical protein